MIAASASAVVLWAQSTPTPSQIAVPPEDITSPGLVGFLVTFALALVSVLLYLSLTKQLRRVNHRAAQLAAVEGADGPDGPGVADRPAGPDARPDADGTEELP